MERASFLNRLFSFGRGRSAVGVGESALPIESESLVEGNAAFALDLYARLKGKPGNLFFSPFSISACLAMVYAGARGDTETQMSQVLHFSQDQTQLRSEFGKLQRQLLEYTQPKTIQMQYNRQFTLPPGVQLDLANALWAQAGHPFLPAFLNIVAAEYQANVNQVDFTKSAGADAAVREINRWVAEKTCDKIRDILPRASVDDLTRLVLANAIYFKGAWNNAFEDGNTSVQPFHLSKSEQTDVRLMAQTEDFAYTGNNEFQALELPYRRIELSMVILLPRRIDGLAELENRLNPAFLSSTLGRMKNQKVEVYFPRFKVEDNFDLKDTLAKMGMPDAFRWPKANLSGLDGTKELYISCIFHKAWCEINEQGTEAAAATVMGVKAFLVLEKPAPPPVFRADHPFIFLIRDIRSGSVLFIGRLTDPRVL
jgi:serpin B